MKTHLILLFSILIDSVVCFSQIENNTVTEAEVLYNTKNYSFALPLFAELLKKNPQNALINYKAGVCYMNSRSQKSRAIQYFEKAISLSAALPAATGQVSEVPVKVYKLLGEAYQQNFNFENAIYAYEKYKKALLHEKEKNPELLESIQKKIEMCRYGNEFKESANLPLNLNALKLSDSTLFKRKDTIWGNYSSNLSADRSSMIYTFKIPIATLRLPYPDNRYFENHFTVRDADTLHQVLKTNKNENSSDTIINSTTIGSSVDGQVVLIYKDDNGEGNLYLTKLVGNQWSLPSKITKCINTAGWESNESISADGQRLFFVSNRPGGYGGNDIYMCRKLATGEWSKASNLGPEINTPYNDEAPFIHPDGFTLFFSSNRNKPAESYDNYTSTLRDSGNWTSPLIVGYPIDKNTQSILVPDEAKKNREKILSAEQKKLPKKKSKSPKKGDEGKNNYLITFLNNKNNPFTFMTGEVDASTKGNEKTLITVADNESGQILSMHHAAKDGYFSFAIPNDKNNNVTFENDSNLFFSENLLIDKDRKYFEKRNSISLPPIADDARILLNNIFFKSDSSVLLPQSGIELNRIFDLMVKNPQLKIALSCYLFENRKGNKKLANARASEIMRYLVEKGINKKRIVPKGYEKTPKKLENIDHYLTVKIEKQILELKVESTKLKIKPK